MLDVEQFEYMGGMTCLAKPELYGISVPLRGVPNCPFFGKFRLSPWIWKSMTKFINFSNCLLMPRGCSKDDGAVILFNLKSLKDEGTS